MLNCYGTFNQSLSSIRESFLKKEIFLSIYKTSLPFLGQNILDVAYNFGIALMIAKLDDTDNIAASSVFMMVQQTLSSMVDSFLLPTRALTAQEFGNQEKDSKALMNAGSILQNSWFLGTLLSIPSVLFFVFISPILKQIGTADNIIDNAAEYALASSIGILASKWVGSDLLFLGAINKANVVFYSTIAMAILGLIFNYLFIFGIGGLPNGLLGAGYANSIQLWISALAFKIYFKFNNDFTPFEIFKPRLPSTRYYLKKLFSLGAPISALAIVQAPETILTAAVLNNLGNNALTVNQIITQYQNLASPPFYAIATATEIQVASEYGKINLHNIPSSEHKPADTDEFKSDQDRLLSSEVSNPTDQNSQQTYAQALRNFGTVGLLASMPWGILTTLIFLFFAIDFIKFFVSSEDFEELGYSSQNLRVFFLLNSLSSAIESVGDVATKNLLAMNDTFIPTAVEVFSSLVYLPVAYLFAFTFGLELAGINIANVILTTFYSITLTFRWNNKSKQVLTEQSSQGECCAKLLTKLSGLFKSRKPSNNLSDTNNDENRSRPDQEEVSLRTPKPI